MYTWSFIVCREITNICYNPRLLLEFQKLCVWFSCLPQHFKYRLKCLLNWRPEQQRAAGLEKDLRKCKHCETCNVDNKSTAQPNYHDYFWTYYISLSVTPWTVTRYNFGWKPTLSHKMTFEDFWNPSPEDAVCCEIEENIIKHDRLHNMTKHQHNQRKYRASNDFRPLNIP